jgi:hypothetical protein
MKYIASVGNELLCTVMIVVYKYYIYDYILMVFPKKSSSNTCSMKYKVIFQMIMENEKSQIIE